MTLRLPVDSTDTAFSVVIRQPSKCRSHHRLLHLTVKDIGLRFFATSSSAVRIFVLGQCGRAPVGKVPFEVAVENSPLRTVTRTILISYAMFLRRHAKDTPARYTLREPPREAQVEFVLGNKLLSNSKLKKHRAFKLWKRAAMQGHIPHQICISLYRCGPHRCDPCAGRGNREPSPGTGVRAPEKVVDAGHTVATALVECISTARA
jgi:hypothetical protein